MFKIRRRQKTSQPTLSHNAELLRQAQVTAMAVLNAAALLARWQGVLAHYHTLLPDQRDAYTPLIECHVSPSLASLVDHAEHHGLITKEQGIQVMTGNVSEVDFSLFSKG